MEAKELRIGNYAIYKGKIVKIVQFSTQTFRYIEDNTLNEVRNDINNLKPIQLTKDVVEKYVDWQFELGFNKSIKEEKYVTVYSYLMENSIDGSSNFEIRFCEDRTLKDNDFIVYLCDGKFVDFGLDDTFHNLQNLFFIISGQELPIKN